MLITERSLRSIIRKIILNEDVVTRVSDPLDPLNYSIKNYRHDTKVKGTIVNIPSDIIKGKFQDIGNALFLSKNYEGDVEDWVIEKIKENIQSSSPSNKKKSEENIDKYIDKVKSQYGDIFSDDKIVIIRLDDGIDSDQTLEQDPSEDRIKHVSDWVVHDTWHSFTDLTLNNSYMIDDEDRPISSILSNEAYVESPIDMFSGEYADESQVNEVLSEWLKKELKDHEVEPVDVSSSIYVLGVKIGWSQVYKDIKNLLEKQLPDEDHTNFLNVLKGQIKVYKDTHSNVLKSIKIVIQN